MPLSSSNPNNNIPSGFFAITGAAAAAPARGTIPPPPPPPPGTTTFGFHYNYNNDSRQNYNHKNNNHNNNRTRGYHVNHLKHHPMQPSSSSASSIVAPIHNNPLLSSSIAKQYRCNACNLNLESASDLERHVQTTHIQCNHCDFRAAPHVVQGHVRVEHGTTTHHNCSGGGFKTITVAVSGCPIQRFRICVGNTTEDIQLWIAERRKRFPRTRNASSSDASSCTTQQQSVHKLKTTTTKKSTQEGGLSSLLAGYSSSSSSSCSDDKNDDDVVFNRDNQNEQGVVTMTSSCRERNATTTLVETAHHVDDDNNNNNNNNQNEPRNDAIGLRKAEEVQINQPESRVRTPTPCRFFSRNGTCRNGDRCRFRHDQQEEQPHDRIHPDADRERPTKLPKNDRRLTTLAINSNPSLLEKLLASDVQRETTLTLQILDYIFESNFLKNVPSLQSSDDTA